MVSLLKTVEMAHADAKFMRHLFSDDVAFRE
jgi:hypothetical protein